MTFVTPTGVLVYDGEPHTPEWYAARREGITGTDLPKILGLSKYGNALSVWRDKRGEAAADEAGEAAKWGLLLEAPIAEAWAEENNTTCRKVGVLAHGNLRWMRASLDRLVGWCPDDGLMNCGLEIKTRSAYVAGKWRDEIPDDVLAQVQWGLMVTGLDHMHVATLIGGQKLHTYRVDHDRLLEEYLLRSARTVWEAVQAGVPPEVHPDAEGVLLRELNAMFAKREGERELPPQTALRHLEDYAEAHRQEVLAKIAKTVNKTALVKMLGDGEAGLVDGQRVFTYRPQKQTDEVTAGQLARLKNECPELYADLVAQGYITKTDPSPKFNLSKRSNTSE